MPITGHCVDENAFWFEVTLSEYGLCEQVAADQVDAEQRALYEYFGNHAWKKKSDNVQCGMMKRKMLSMILDYIEVGHWEAAIELIDMAIATKQKPPSRLVGAMVDMMLKPPTEGVSDPILASSGAHNVLCYTMEVFGPELIQEIWSTFRTMTLGRWPGKRLREEDSDEDEPSTANGAVFEQGDFWSFVKACFEETNDVITARCRLATLDILVRSLEYDLAQRRGSDRELAKCLFLQTLQGDVLGVTRKLDRYLDILFIAFTRTEWSHETLALSELHAASASLARRLFNMFIVLSCCDAKGSSGRRDQNGQLVPFSSLVEESYRRFSQLDFAPSADVMNVSQNALFTRALCDLALADADCKSVDKAHRHLRKNRHPGTRVQRFLHFVVKTRPNQLKSMYDVARHVIIVNWYFQSLVDELSLRYDSDKTHVMLLLSEEELLALIEDGPSALETWRRNVADMMASVPPNVDLEQEIHWILDLAELNLILD